MRQKILKFLRVPASYYQLVLVVVNQRDCFSDATFYDLSCYLPTSTTMEEDDNGGFLVQQALANNRRQKAGRSKGQPNFKID